MEHTKSLKIGFSWIALCLIGLSLVPFATADDGAYKFDWKWGSVAKTSE